MACYAYRLAVGIALLTVPTWEGRRDVAAVALGLMLAGFFFIIYNVEDLDDKVRKFKLYYCFLLPLESVFLLVAVTHPDIDAARDGAGALMLISLCLCVLLRHADCCRTKAGWCGCWKEGALANA